MSEFFRLLEAEAAEPKGVNEQWGLVGSTVVTGLVVVFLILALLVLFLWLFGKIFKVINEAGDRKARRKIEMNNDMKSFKLETPAAASPVSRTPAATLKQAVAVEPDYEEEDDEEIIAVIAAAIAAFGEAEGKQYRIASIKRPRNARSGWSSAGIADNMRGFMN